MVVTPEEYERMRQVQATEGRRNVPPNDAQPPEEICDEDPKHAIPPPISGDAGVARVVAEEGDLVPPCSEGDGREEVVGRRDGRLVEEHPKDKEGDVDAKNVFVAGKGGRGSVEAERLEVGLEFPLAESEVVLVRRGQGEELVGSAGRIDHLGGEGLPALPHLLLRREHLLDVSLPLLGLRHGDPGYGQRPHPELHRGDHVDPAILTRLDATNDPSPHALANGAPRVVHLDLVARVAADEVEDGQVPSGVHVEPCCRDAVDEGEVYDEELAGCDTGGDFGAGEEREGVQVGMSGGFGAWHEGREP